MNSETVPSTDSTALLTRRDAIRRTALLLGVALSPSWLEGVAQAQSASAAPHSTVNLTAAQRATVAAIAERILPRSETPGAGDVGVPAFIDRMVGGYMTEAERKTFTDGLADVESRSSQAHRRGFAQLTAAQQDALLRTLALESQAKEKTFFHQIKDLTLIGYFTSEPVGRNVTNFDPLPGRFDACIPLSEVGNRAWTR